MLARTSNIMITLLIRFQSDLCFGWSVTDLWSNSVWWFDGCLNNVKFCFMLWMLTFLQIVDCLIFTDLIFMLLLDFHHRHTCFNLFSFLCAIYIHTQTHTYMYNAWLLFKFPHNGIKENKTDQKYNVLFYLFQKTCRPLEHRYAEWKPRNLIPRLLISQSSYRMHRFKDFNFANIFLDLLENCD